MKTSIDTFTTLAAVLISITTAAQQEPRFTQFMDNTVYVNPAYAGSADRMIIQTMSRFQWAGFKGAPLTNTITMNTPLRYHSVGLGGTLVHDKLGPVTNTIVAADFSYTLFLRNDLRLSFGLKGGVNILNVDVAELIRVDEGDQLLSQNIRNQATPNFGFGIYLRNPKWYIGISSPKLLEYTPSMSLAGQYQQVRHYYTIAGFVARLSDDLKLRPASMFRFTPGAPASLDLNLSLIIRDRIWIGALYHLQESTGLMFQFMVTPQFKVGYAFEYAATSITKNTAGTHELLLSYDLVFKARKILSPRYF